MGKNKKKSTGSTPNRNMNVPVQVQEDRAALRNQYITDTVGDYVAHQKRTNIAQLVFKSFFFIMVCSAFCGVVWVSISIMLNISKRTDISIEEVSIAITSLVSLLSAVIVLPTKIAEHLFPSAGEKDIADFIIKMHEMDSKILGERNGTHVGDKTEEDDDLDFRQSGHNQ